MSRIWTEGGGTTDLAAEGGWGEITATWIEPTFPPDGWVVVWAGIASGNGCPSSGCLVQAGVGGDAGTVNGSAAGGFWMEDYPRPVSAKRMPPNPPLGDLVSATLTRVAPGCWRVTTADLGQHTSATYTEAWSSGEVSVFAVEAATGMPGRPLCTPVGWVTATATARSGRVVNALTAIGATQAANVANGANAANGCGSPPPPSLIGATATVSMASMPNGGGYWIATANGGVFTVGNAPFDGSIGEIPLNAPVVGIAPDPVTCGYWEVRADGGIFTFDAPFLGSGAR